MHLIRCTLSGRFQGRIGVFLQLLCRTPLGYFPICQLLRKRSLKAKYPVCVFQACFFSMCICSEILDLAYLVQQAVAIFKH